MPAAPVGGLQHGLEPLLHRFQPSDQRERHAVGASGKGEEPCPVPFSGQARPFVYFRAYHRLNRRSAGWSGRLRLATGSGCALLPLWLLLRTLSDMGPERIESRLLLVAE